jgi:signal peptidase I
MHLRGHSALRIIGQGVMIALLLVSSLRLWWVPFWVPSESMKPNLLEGDYIMVRYGQPLERGDVIVFTDPVSRQAHVKRVIGLASDRIALQAGQVFVNETPLGQLPVGSFSETMGPKGPDQLRPRCSEGLVGDGAICRKDISQEVLPNARRYLVANIGDGLASDDFAAVTVPAGTMFLLGDNRDNSLDSRFTQTVGGLGFVPLENHIGHVRKVVFSAEGASLLAIWAWRAGRFWEKVQ